MNEVDKINEDIKNGLSFLKNVNIVPKQLPTLSNKPFTLKNLDCVEVENERKVQSINNNLDL